MEGLGATLRRAILAGLIAGALAALFHQVLTEPVIDRAIAAEAARAAPSAAHGHEAPVVSRRGQKIGLVAGLLVYGLIWGVLVGLGAHVARGWAPAGWSAGRRGLVVAGLAGWSVALFPFLKYPANPPGVGEPGSIGRRQALYLGFILLSVLGTVLAASLWRRLRATSPGARAWLAPAAFYAVWALAIFALMPPSPDPVELAEAIVRPFRTLALAGLVVFWGALALLLAYLGRASAGVPARIGR